jgi:hypothetical protein
MSKLTRAFVFTVLIVLLASFGAADEGMWMPHQMKDLDLKTKGLKMNPGDLYKEDGTGLMSAVVNLRGGTAEFVSSEGLLLTNHHVAYRAVQMASDQEHDYITHGFLAKTRAGEIPARGYTADVLLGYDDVTAAVVKRLKRRMTAKQRFEAIDRIKKKLIANEEKKGKDIHCTVSSMYSGNRYYLFKFKRLRDVRLVYAPPNTIGNYGGDIDNWMWPRHTGDFSFLRAYVSKDNFGAPYSKDNVPYRPKSYFKISLDGLEDGDFTFIMGYPGRTYRNFSYGELQSDIERMQMRLSLFKGAIDFFEKAGKDDRGIQIKYASLVRGLNNALKNYTGKLEGLQKYHIKAKKQEAEKKFRSWVMQNPARQKKYANALENIDTFIKQKKAFYDKEQRMSNLLSRYSGNVLLSQAYTIYRTAVESQKPDIKRAARYQKRDLPYIKMRVNMAERSYHPEVDKAYFKHILGNLLKQDKSQYPAALVPVLEKGESGIAAYVDELYKNTILKDQQKRLELLGLKPKALLKLNDPFIKLAAELEKEWKVLRDKKDAVDQEREDLRKIYKAALLEMFEGKFAPDANSSIRFTYGPVKGYHPRDAVTYLPFTTIKGIMEKETGTFPFEVPAKLKELYKARDFGRYADKQLGDIVTCFLNTTNITGGNSGSPVLNAKGEQVGIVFDMTYESVIGDYYIIPELQRSISVDIRYVIYVTDKLAGASFLLKEMGL